MRSTYRVLSPPDKGERINRGGRERAGEGGCPKWSGYVYLHGKDTPYSSEESTKLAGTLASLFCCTTNYNPSQEVSKIVHPMTSLSRIDERLHFF